MHRKAIGIFFFGMLGFFMALSVISALEFQVTTISNHVDRGFIVALLSLSLVCFIFSILLGEEKETTLGQVTYKNGLRSRSIVNRSLRLRPHSNQRASQI